MCETVEHIMKNINTHSYDFRLHNQTNLILSHTWSEYTEARLNCYSSQLERVNVLRSMEFIHGIWIVFFLLLSYLACTHECMNIVTEFCDALPKQNYTYKYEYMWWNTWKTERKRKRTKRTPQMKYNNFRWSVICLKHNIHWWPAQLKCNEA